MKKQQLLDKCRELNLRPGDKVKVRFTEEGKRNYRLYSVNRRKKCYSHRRRAAFTGEIARTLRRTCETRSECRDRNKRLCSAEAISGKMSGIRRKAIADNGLQTPIKQNGKAYVYGEFQVSAKN